MQAEFWKFDTAGNTTLFVDRPEILPKALAVIPSEQGGFFRANSLEMAGGEMCVNACLAFAALLDAIGETADSMRIAGQKVLISAEGEIPAWRCRAEFALDGCEKETGVNLAHFEGISHALIETEFFPEERDALAEAKILRRRLGLDSRKAAGVVWWRKLDSALEILPVVAVPGAGSCNLEGACGSGSIALALNLGEGAYDIRQPSGEFLKVAIEAGKAVIEGESRLAAKGALWL